MVNTERKDWWKIQEERVALRKGWSTEGTDGIYIEEDTDAVTEKKRWKE